ncbi:MAG TPA: pyridoxamine 5'-phosphate oxidase family protein [Polyangiaceae bacterium]|jgi:hypothetical protein|nr:MAG: hypothetical protein BWY17_03687 [Deltaproteobacteria bacterium ADurb.Bin207]HNS97985.1 pyridoxamine 5'-phosphate oxidase family protein [Polyangiaceae bacterium]HNZ24692.1 pyridoxamine 5'-phosphate oxidase family protein [Polyangiaceae bacterium]HOD23426.1 pyridoxamine 5'-phosphate oxidase family protein [Polyangiaceae bacterium]HOE49994.1 pyridoxamine 5'-phosphate oxidase family protein [Polyangiaceae bacterium]
MDLKAYFRDHRGHGVLSTSNDKGEVGIAMFAKPHVMDDGTVAFIMQHKQTHANLQTNPHAAYLFIEAVPEGGKKWAGKRLYLRKVHEEKDTERLYAMRRHSRDPGDKQRYLVFFEVLKTLPLSGTTDT